MLCSALNFPNLSSLIEILNVSLVRCMRLPAECWRRRACEERGGKCVICCALDFQSLCDQTLIGRVRFFIGPLSRLARYFSRSVLIGDLWCVPLPLPCNIPRPSNNTPGPAHCSGCFISPGSLVKKQSNTIR